MTRSNNIFLIPGVGHLDLLVKLLGCGVESAVARRTTNRGLGFDVATHLPTTYTYRKVTKAGVGRVVETCAAMFAANLISSSHFCKVLSGLTCCSRCKGTAVLCQVVTQNRKSANFHKKNRAKVLLPPPRCLFGWLIWGA